MRCFFPSLSSCFPFLTNLLPSLPTASTPSPPLPRAAPSSSAAAAAAPAALSPGSAAIATADAEIARRFFSLPENAVNVESMDAGAYRRLMELAKKAKVRFSFLRLSRPSFLPFSVKRRTDAA